MRFKATIQLDGKTATGIHIPEEVVEGLGGGKRPPVRATINGHAYRTTVAPVRGESKIPVSAEVRERVGVSAGDEVDVEVELDTEPREVAVPQDFAEVLERDAELRRTFDGLSRSKKRRLVDPIGQAKTAETRQRRIDKAIDALREGRT
jgi:bifunctional DNA-binding transcriptional regulator/antitoxin component of YhaV-PrlF toxin-antitoxin module